MLSVAAIVAWRSANALEGRLIAATLVGLSFNNSWQYYAIDDPLLWPSVALDYAGVGFGVVSAARFAAIYRNAARDPVRLALARVGVACGALAAVVGTAYWIDILVLRAGHFVLDRLFWFAWVAGDISVLVSCLVAVRRASAEDRSRVAWVAAAFAIGAAGTAAHGLLRLATRESSWSFVADSLAQVVFVGILAYALVRRSALGSNFFIDRVVVYGAIAGALTGAYYLIEALAHELLQTVASAVPERVRIPELAVKLGVTILVAVSSKRIERGADVLLARLRGREQREHDDAAPVSFAPAGAATPADVLAALVEAYVAYEAVGAAALYERNRAGRYVRRGEAVDGLPDSLAATDARLRRLVEFGAEMFEIAADRIALAVPIPVHSELEAFVLCFARRRAFTPGETRALGEAAVRAALAIDDLAVAGLRARLHALERPRRRRKRVKR